MQAMHAISALGSMLGNYKNNNKFTQKKKENKNILMKTRKGNNG